MKLLAIETAAEACSAALWLDGTVRERHRLAPRRHSELILPMMEALLAEAGLRLGQLDALAFGRGPGSFTGVRIAAGVIQGAAFAADLPVVPVSTLATLAQHCFRAYGARQILSAFDARMDEVYWGAYRIDEADLARPCQAERVVAPERVPLPDGDGWYGAGGGWRSYEGILTERLGAQLRAVDPELSCHAGDLVRLAADALARGETVPPEQALPVYLRDRVAKKPAPAAMQPLEVGR